MNLSDKFKENPLLWGMYYFPNHFRVDSPSFHLKILKEAMLNKRLAVASPRESAKSTIISFLLPTHSVFFSTKRFIVIVQNTYAKATGTLLTIKKELMENQLIIKDCKLEVLKDAEGDTIFRQDGFDTRILCKGSEQIGSLRGEKFGAYRPDLIIVDDVEDDEMVRNPERRKDLCQVFDEALVPAGEKGVCDIWVIGTILHDDSLMAKLVSKTQYPEYKKLVYKALNEKMGILSSLWPQKWSVNDLLKLQREKPSVFAKEYQNDPVSGAMARFKREHFRYWRVENGNYILLMNEEISGKGRLCDCKAAIACDLAWKETKETDSTVIMPAYLTPESYILVDDYITKRGMRPDEFTEILFSLETRLKNETGSYVLIGFEKAMLEKVYNWILKQKMRQTNHWLMTKELKWETDKITRCETVLQPRYAQGAIFHKKGQGDLEYQLTRFPSGTHDDLVDALQGVCRLLEFPKTLKDVEKKTDEFSWWRAQALAQNKPPRKRFVYGLKGKSRPLIPALKSFR